MFAPPWLSITFVRILFLPKDLHTFSCLPVSVCRPGTNQWLLLGLPSRDQSVVAAWSAARNQSVAAWSATRNQSVVAAWSATRAARALLIFPKAFCIFGSPGLSCALLGSSVSPGLSWGSWALLGFPGAPGLSWALLSSPGLSLALLRSPGLSWALQGSPWGSWALLSSGLSRAGSAPEFSWARLCSPGLSWVLLGSPGFLLGWYCVLGRPWLQDVVSSRHRAG